MLPLIFLTTQSSINVRHQGQGDTNDAKDHTAALCAQIKGTVSHGCHKQQDQSGAEHYHEGEARLVARTGLLQKSQIVRVVQNEEREAHQRHLEEEHARQADDQS